MALLICLALAGLWHAEAVLHGFAKPGSAPWTPESVPNPRIHAHRCGMVSSGRLCDPDRILSERRREEILNVMHNINHKTRLQCPDGRNQSFQAAALVVKSISSAAWVGSKEWTAERFAHHVSDSWGVGDTSCGNGLFLFLGVSDGMLYLKTAASARAKIPDATAEHITNNMKELLHRGKVGEAILEGSEEIFQYLYDAAKSSLSFQERAIVYSFVFVVAFISLPALALFVLVPVLFILLQCLLCPLAACADSLASCVWRHHFSSVQENLERMQVERDSTLICTICLGDFSEGSGSVEALPCGHHVHERCIAEWKQEQLGSCPMCDHDNAADIPLLPEDYALPTSYQRRLKFCLSRVHALYFGGEAAFDMNSRTAPWYFRDVNGKLQITVPHRCAMALDAFLASAESSMSYYGLTGLRSMISRCYRGSSAALLGS